MIPKYVSILLFDQVELLDFAGPLEVFYRAKKSLENYDKDVLLFEATTISVEKKEIRVFGGLKVIPAHVTTSTTGIDFLIIPGELGARAMTTNSPEVVFVRKAIRTMPYIATVCTGIWVLALTGEIAGKHVTTHHSRYDSFQKAFPDISLVKNQKEVEDEQVISAGGVSSGIDLGLYIVGKFQGEEALKTTEDVLEYNLSKKIQSMPM